MRVRILGSAAGGGSPQWNCRCAVCALAWAGDPRVPWRTQCSTAVSADGERWVLLNASPDLRQQILENPPLRPSRDGRHSPLAAVIVTNADVDHVAGLLTLREGQKLTVAAPPQVLAQIDANPIFGVLNRDLVAFRSLQPGEPQEIAGLEITAFPVSAKVPLWLEGTADTLAAEGTGLMIRSPGRQIAHVTACAEVTDDLRRRVAGSDLLLFDGTLWQDDELVRAGLGTKTGRRMGHVPISGAGGALDAWRDVPVGRRLFIHVNNTNPVLIAGSPERLAVQDAGWDVAVDGMEITL